MPKSFTAHVIKIHEGKYSRTENVYFRIGMRLETGEFAFTDAVPTYRNFAWWKPIIAAGKGTKIGHLFLIEGFRKPLKVNADSEPVIIQETLIKDPPLPVEQEIYQARAGNPEIWIVKGDKGRSYDITIMNGFAECTCEAFRFSGRKRECKHTKKVAVHKKDIAAKDLKRRQGTLL